MTGIDMKHTTMKKHVDQPKLYDKQRGDFLLEALIGMVLMAIISMGVVYVTSKASVAQRDMQVQEIAKTQLRNKLQSGSGLCAAGNNITLPGGATVDITTQGCTNTARTSLTASINGATVPDVPSPVIMSANLGADTCKDCSVIVGGTWIETTTTTGTGTEIQ